ncbi:MAG: ferric reductase-like transmembrane domain-containing protein [Anaerolineae bacterium]|nr:ferric reductase-like transmembrane domain-containing protein [Anaerolineae bacterium]
MLNRTWWKRHGFLIAVHIGALLPLGLLVLDYAQQRFLVDPVREIMTRTGRIALTVLLLSLTCTPVYVLFRFKPVLRARRPLGLYAFLYAMIHFLTFAGWDYGFNLRLLWQAITYQRFIIAGAIALIILLLLAVTSTQEWQHRLGKHWQRLHRTVYLAAMLVILHFFWLAKTPDRPMRYALLLGGLLMLRLPQIKQVVTNIRKGK